MDIKDQKNILNKYNKIKEQKINALFFYKNTLGKGYFYYGTSLIDSKSSLFFTTSKVFLL